MCGVAPRPPYLLRIRTSANAPPRRRPGSSRVTSLTKVARRYRDLSNWAPAFAGEVLFLIESDGLHGVGGGQRRKARL